MDAHSSSHQRRLECLSRLSPGCYQFMQNEVWKTNSSSGLCLGVLPQVDRMATCLNHCLPQYVSPYSRSKCSSHRRNVLGLEQMGINISVSSSQGTFVRSELFPNCRTFVASSVLVSNSVGMVFQPQRVPQSSSISTSARQDSFLQLFAFHQYCTCGVLKDISICMVMQWPHSF